MTVAKQVITFHYELKGSEGEILDSSKGETPLSFLEGSQQIIPGLEEVLLILKKGESKNVSIPYRDAYGAYDQTLVAKIPQDQCPSQPLNVGDVFEVEKKGMRRMVTVVEVADDTIIVDANHPLAGKDLNFWVEIINRRDATAEEIDHGHVH